MILKPKHIRRIAMAYGVLDIIEPYITKEGMTASELEEIFKKEGIEHLLVEHDALKEYCDSRTGYSPYTKCDDCEMERECLHRMREEEKRGRKREFLYR